MIAAFALTFAATQALALQPVAHYSLNDAQALGEDSSGNGLTASVANAKPVRARIDGGIALDGSGGLEIPSSPLLRSSIGFAVDMWIRLDDVSENTTIAAKPGEWLIRVDPASEGGDISFFVNAADSLEPRVRGPRAQPDKWYHIIATWDGAHAALWINGEQYRMKRTGFIRDSDSPLLIGKPSEFGRSGVKGVIDSVRLYDQPLGDAEILLAGYGLASETPPGDEAPDPAALARFEFTDGPQGWQAHEAQGFAARDSRLTMTAHGHGSAFVRRDLRISLEHKPYLCLRLSVDAGERGRLLFVTSEGVGALDLALKPDAEFHSYVLRLSDHPKWLGVLTTLAVAPSDADAACALDFVRVSSEPDAPPEITVRSMLPKEPILRAGGPGSILATLHNSAGPAQDVTAHLTASAGLEILAPASKRVTGLGHEDCLELSWSVRADHADTFSLDLALSGDGMTPVQSSVDLAMLPAVNLPPADYVPEPKIARTDLLVGAHYCPLWKQGSRSSGWELIEPYPQREPALGWYDEDDPEVTDWEIKWALEHGISYFVYCWYRRDQGHGVDMNLEHAIHEGLFRCRYRDRFKFTIMWENQWKGVAGVASEEDFLQNLLPFWIETYFKHPSYLVVDKKPVLFIYRPEFLVDDLGSVEAVRQALDKARAACREAGFDGLTILGEYRGVDPRPLRLMVDEGLDASFAYCWPVGGDPDPDTAVRTQEDYWNTHRELDIIPEVITVSMGWDSTPWHGFTHSAWHLPPSEFQRLCEAAREYAKSRPPDDLGSRLVLLDNWNEFGEGHYIAPHREYGFGYLDAVRSAFAIDPDQPHVDILPQDVGLGPYDSRYRAYVQRIEACKTRVVGDGLRPGVTAWWSFDEEDDTLCAMDYSGNRQGGALKDAERVPGFRGKALNCHGGSVTIPRGAFHHPVDEVTVECWINTDLGGQTDKWFVNNIFGNGASGFRLGLSGGRLAWAIPLTSWSHQLVASETLPLGEWVHVAATYDGRTMRLYQNGEEVGSLMRGGRIHPADSVLCLGSYHTTHRAHFTGLLDEVRIHSRALTAAEIRALSRPEG